MKVIKNLTIFIISVLFIFCSYSIVMFRGIKSHSIKEYNQLTNRISVFPEMDYFKGYSDIEFIHYKRSFMGFSSDAYTLRVEYNPVKYYTEKEILDKNFIFKCEDVTDDQGNISSPDFNKESFDIQLQNINNGIFSIGNFNFKLLDDDTYKMTYPKEFVLIGYSDLECEIAYIYFYDYNLDAIKSFDMFLTEYCGWV